MFDILYLDKKEDLEIYKNLINKFFKDSAYNSIDYFDVFCGGLNNLICFYYIDGSKKIILPGYLKQIEIHGEDTGFKDFVTPYGYSGSYNSSAVELKELEDFWIKVKNWLYKNNIVSEFIRFNLFNNDVGFNGFIHNTMLNIKGEIIGKEEQWNNFEHKVRKNVKKAIRENLSSKIFHTNIDEITVENFYDVYIETMKRTNANESFFYSIDLFKKFCINNPTCAICLIYDQDIVVSSELLLISDNSVFSFLGGTLGEYFDKRPNDFLKFEVINWARENGFDNYVLGGGYGYEDGIFKYKKSFFPNNVVTYKTGRLVINENNYSKLVQKNNLQRIKKGLVALDLHDESFFPLYNKQN